MSYLIWKRTVLMKYIKSRRNLFNYLNVIFNKVDEDRVKLVGPDRSCAEWLMRNGAFVRWAGHEDFVSHYDKLPLDEPPDIKYFIQEVRAVGASINKNGFPHFQGCTQISKVNISDCWYVDDQCMIYFNFLADSLKTLEISKCAEITDKGLMALTSLRNLENLYIGNLSGVNHFEKCISEINLALPNCKIEKID